MKKKLFMLVLIMVLACMNIAHAMDAGLVIGGKGIKNGMGFLNNFVCLTQDKLEKLYEKPTGETTYRLKLGDSMLANTVTYSTFENHGAPTWGYRSVMGIDVCKLAQALGVDVSTVMSVTAYAADGTSKTLSDAFNTAKARVAFDAQGAVYGEVPPVLALFETKTGTHERPQSENVAALPALPALGAQSAARVAPVFGFGQVEQDEITACFWVKDVNRLRIGAEDVAFTLVSGDGKKKTLSISSIILLGFEERVYGEDALRGLALEALLTGMGVELPDSLIAQNAAGETLTMQKADIQNAFVAWDGTRRGVSIQNTTALMLYVNDEVLPDLTGMQV